MKKRRIDVIRNVLDRWFLSYSRSSGNNGEERGIALLMTLGILSILIVLALSFASSSMVTNKIAHYAADSVKGKLMVESAVDTAVGLINMQQKDPPSLDWNPNGFMSTSSDDDDPRDHLSKIATTLRNGKSLFTDSMMNNIGWNYIHHDGKIIGRYAFIAVGKTGALDPSACVTHTCDDDPTWDVPGAQDETDITANKRYGVHIYEMNLGNLDLSNDPEKVFNDDVVQKLSSDAVPGGRLVDVTSNTPGRWESFEKLFTEVGLAVSDDDGALLQQKKLDVQKKCREEWMVLNSVEDPEAFWIDGDDDGRRDDGELYNRFNLREFTDKDDDGIYTSGVDENWWDSQENKIKNPFYSKDQTKWDGENYEIKGINYLNDRADSFSPGTFENNKNRKDQIKANLIDYCDTDDVPTSNIEAESWGPDSIPVYTGNERTAYISECAAMINCKAKVKLGKDGITPVQYIYTPNKLKIAVEAVNMYSSAVSSVSAHIYGELKLTYTKPNGDTTVSDTYPISEVIDFDTIDARKYKAVTKTSIDLQDHSFYIVGEATNDPELKVELSIKCIILSMGGGNVDFATLHKNSGSYDITNVFQYPGSGETEIARWYDWEVDDPRQNLNELDWHPTTLSQPQVSSNNKTSLGDADVGSPNAKTSWETSATSGDMEPQNNYGAGGLVSTAYIRNDLMMSPWELGAIHRGAAWQTINLCRYNTVKEHIGAYSNGDANILDQVKMTNDLKCWGKFNLNAWTPDTESPNAYRVLAMGIDIPAENNDDIYDINDDTVSIDKDTGDTIAEAIIHKLKGDDIDGDGVADGGSNYQHRGEVANELNIVDNSRFRALVSSGDYIDYKGNNKTGTPSDSNVAREALIGKFINLCKANQVKATIINLIVIAQVIKDIGGVTIRKDLDFDGKTDKADETICGWDCNGDGDALDTNVKEEINTTENKYDLNGDSILSEAKAWATLYLNPTNNRWEISQLMFMDEQ